MKQTHPHARPTNAISLAIASMLLATSAQAGKIADTNPTTTAGAFLGDCGAAGAAEACVGAWNLGNVSVQQEHADGTAFGSFNTTNGAYAAMVARDSFVSSVKDAMGSIMAKVTGKVWPIGEPTGIKAVNADTQTKNGKPQNCLINSSYLGAADSKSGSDAYLDVLAPGIPEPVICSSGFQSHKRFKIAMQPATVVTTAAGAAGEGIDMVFNVTDNSALTSYQVFSKINNYTDKRLKGYKIVVGTGVGSAFVPASLPVTGGRPAIADKLHISLGKGEGAKGSGALDGSDLFDGDGLATFSHGLFGAIDTNFTTNGFFDTRTAGFNVTQTCSAAPCATTPNPFAGGAALIQSDTIESTTVLASNYASKFGDWLPSKWQPSGVFFDDDNDPNTDPVLKAWWDGSQWVGNNDGGFTPIPAATLEAWGKDPLYEVTKIEDVLNLGINYIVKVGDDLDNDAMTNTSTFTVRIIPVVADSQTVPTFLATEPASLTPPATTPTVVATGGGGGCTTADGKQSVDPMLPLFAALGFAGWALRRRSRNSSSSKNT